MSGLCTVIEDFSSKSELDGLSKVKIIENDTIVSLPVGSRMRCLHVILSTCQKL